MIPHSTIKLHPSLSGSLNITKRPTYFSLPSSLIDLWLMDTDARRVPYDSKSRRFKQTWGEAAVFMWYTRKLRYRKGSDVSRCKSLIGSSEDQSTPMRMLALNSVTNCLTSLSLLETPLSTTHWSPHEILIPSNRDADPDTFSKLLPGTVEIVSGPLRCWDLYRKAAKQWSLIFVSRAQPISRCEMKMMGMGMGIRRDERNEQNTKPHVLPLDWKSSSSSAFRPVHAKQEMRITTTESRWAMELVCMSMMWSNVMSFTLRRYRGRDTGIATRVRRRWSECRSHCH